MRHHSRFIMSINFIFVNRYNRNVVACTGGQNSSPEPIEQVQQASLNGPRALTGADP